MATFELGQCMAQLWHADPSERLEAVRRLREFGDAAAGPDLLRCLDEALEREGDWDFQHGLIGALGACNYRPALARLEGLREAAGLAPEVEEALGMALVQLSTLHDNDAGPVLELMDAGRPALAQGALQAMARLRMVPDEETTGKLVDFALAADLARDAWSLIWILRAAPGWQGEARDRLLEHYAAPEYGQLRQVNRALKLAQQGEYQDWGQF